MQPVAQPAAGVATDRGGGRAGRACCTVPAKPDARAANEARARSTPRSSGAGAAAAAASALRRPALLRPASSPAPGRLGGAASASAGPAPAGPAGPEAELWQQREAAAAQQAVSTSVASAAAPQATLAGAASPRFEDLWIGLKREQQLRDSLQPAPQEGSVSPHPGLRMASPLRLAAWGADYPVQNLLPLQNEEDGRPGTGVTSGSGTPPADSPALWLHPLRRNNSQAEESWRQLTTSSDSLAHSSASLSVTEGEEPLESSPGEAQHPQRCGLAATAVLRGPEATMESAAVEFETRQLRSLLAERDEQLRAEVAVAAAAREENAQLLAHGLEFAANSEEKAAELLLSAAGAKQWAAPFLHSPSGCELTAVANKDAKDAECHADATTEQAAAQLLTALERTEAIVTRLRAVPEASHAAPHPSAGGAAAAAAGCVAERMGAALTRTQAMLMWSGAQVWAEKLGATKAAAPPRGLPPRPPTAAAAAAASEAAERPRAPTQECVVQQLQDENRLLREALAERDRQMFVQQAWASTATAEILELQAWASTASSEILELKASLDAHSGDSGRGGLPHGYGEAPAAARTQSSGPEATPEDSPRHSYRVGANAALALAMPQASRGGSCSSGRGGSGGSAAAERLRGAAALIGGAWWAPPALQPAAAVPEITLEAGRQPALPLLLPAGEPPPPQVGADATAMAEGGASPLLARR